MADALVKHAFVSAIPEGLDPTQLRTSNWNAALLFTGGNAGDILTRDAGSATGAAWTAGLATWAGSTNLTTLGVLPNLLTIGTVANRIFYLDPTAGTITLGQTGNVVGVLAINRDIDDPLIQFGINVITRFSAPGVTQEGTGIRVAVSYANGTSKGASAGLVVEGPTFVGTGFVTDYYSGIFRGTHTADAANPASITTGTTLALEFSKSQTLWVCTDQNPTTPSGGIIFGSSKDTNLYRGAAGQLTTDGKVRITGALGVVGSPNASAAITIGASAGIPSSGNISRVIYNTAFIPVTSTTQASGYESTLGTIAGAFTIANLYHINIADVALGSGSAVTTQYGLNIAPLTVAGSNVGIAIGKASTQTLWICRSADDTTAAGGLAFGASRDTNLYRSAANVLKTDDALDAASFKVGGVAGVNFGPAHPASITIVNGIVTACS